MKSVLSALVFLIVIAATAWGIWAGHKSSTQAIASHAPSIAPTQVARPSATPPSPGLLAFNEWQELRNAREMTLKNNPKLAAEYKTLLAEMDEQQKELDTAMVKADPKVAPIVAKLEALRKHNSVPSTPALNR